MDVSVEKSHTPPTSQQPDYNNGEKGVEETEKLQPAPASEATEHNNAKKGPSQISAPEPDDPQFPKGVALALILFSVWLALFLVAIDRTIIATAIPHITDQFHSLDDVGWYASSYMLTNCAVQLLYGRIYKFYSTKWVFLGCIGIFEIGSAICGAAPNSISFIIGRSIAGLGSAGIFSGSMMVMLHTVPLHRRPIFAGFFGATFGIASVVAPLLGGVFTDKVSWRWCFYINLPIGGVSIIVIALILKVPDAENGKVKGLSLRQQFLQLDPLGTSCLLPSIVCLILALQWGGTTYAWSSWRVITLLSLFSILFAIFLGIQAWKKDDALVPLRIVVHRSIAAGALFTFSTAGSMIVIIFYLTIWFQAIKGVTALESGIRLIPTILGLALSSTIFGFVTTKIGYYVPAMYFTSVAASIATGLMTTFTPETNHASWIGLQVLYGLGIGSARQVTGLAAQAVLPKSDVAIGTAVMFFSQGIGGVVFVSAAQNLFLNSLVSGVADIPGLNARTILNTGATALQTSVAPQYLKELIVAYNHALTRTFVLATCLICLSIIGSLTMEWKNIKGMRRGGPGGARGSEKEVVKV